MALNSREPKLRLWEKIRHIQGNFSINHVEGARRTDWATLKAFQVMGLVGFRHNGSNSRKKPKFYIIEDKDFPPEFLDVKIEDSNRTGQLVFGKVPKAERPKPVPAPKKGNNLGRWRKQVVKEFPGKGYRCAKCQYVRYAQSKDRLPGWGMYKGQLLCKPCLKYELEREMIA